MKTLTTIAGLTLFATCAMGGSIPVGRGEVSFDVSGSATYDTNVIGRNGGDDDYYGTVSPRVTYTRRAGQLEADASASVSSSRYVDHDEFDSDNIQADASVKLSEKSFPNLAASFGVNYTESFTVDNDVNARIKSKTASANARAELTTGPRTKVGGHGLYSKVLRTGASDQEMYTAGLNFDYSGFMDDTTLNLLYDYSNTRSSGDNVAGVDLDQSSHYFSAGLSRAIYHDVTGRVSYGYRILNRSAAETSSGTTEDTSTILSASVNGPLLPARLFPKIKSHFSLSYEEAASPGINDSGSKRIAGSLGLTWLARETTTVSIDVNRNQRLSSTDFTVVSTTARLELQQKLRHNLTGSLGTGYDWETYQGITRSDDVFSFDANLNYTFGRSWGASASYRFTSTRSSAQIAQFKHGVVSLTLTYRF